MRETILNRGQGATNFMKERLNVNIGVRKVRRPHNFCQNYSLRASLKDIPRVSRLKNPSYKLGTYISFFREFKKILEGRSTFAPVRRHPMQWRYNLKALVSSGI
jgi:hypothetical protein